MADREPLCFLAPVVSGQSHQWREDHRERSPPNQQPSDHCFEDGRQHAAEKRYLSRSAVSSTQNQARSPCAIKAMAAKLARLVYRMPRYGMKYVDQGAAFYELRHRELQIKRLKAKAEKLGYRVTPIPAAA
jgi:hypothetical protein